MSFTTLRSRWLTGAIPAFALTALASGQAPEIIHYNFDAGDATNTAVPGVGNGTPVMGVTFIPNGASCSAAGAPAAQSDGTSRIDSGWQVDVGTSDYTIGMHLDLTAGTNAFQYYFGSSSTGGFRCFSRGAAGADGIMLRTLGGGDVIIAGGVSNVVPTHVCWVYDSSVPEVRGYADGVLNAAVTQTAPANLLGTSADFNVMTYTTTEMLANNVMDDFRFYRRALTQSEIDDWVNNCSTGGPTTLGTNYECPATVLNSSGNAAVIAATGSDTAGDNNVTLTTTGMPTGASTFGYFLNSQAQNVAGFNPPGSQGQLCVGPGGIGRYNASVFNASGTGEGSLILDLTMTPTPAGNVAIQAGETWYFTTWFRDANPNPTSNFSDAVCITFN